MIDRIMNINIVDRSNKLFKSIVAGLDESWSNHRYKARKRSYITNNVCVCVCVSCLSSGLFMLLERAYRFSHLNRKWEQTYINRPDINKHIYLSEIEKNIFTEFCDLGSRINHVRNYVVDVKSRVIFRFRLVSGFTSSETSYLNRKNPVNTNVRLWCLC